VEMITLRENYLAWKEYSPKLITLRGTETDYLAWL